MTHYDIRWNGLLLTLTKADIARMNAGETDTNYDEDLARIGMAHSALKTKDPFSEGDHADIRIVTKKDGKWMKCHACKPVIGPRLVHSHLSYPANQYSFRTWTTVKCAYSPSARCSRSQDRKPTCYSSMMIPASPLSHIIKRRHPSVSPSIDVISNIPNKKNGKKNERISFSKEPDCLFTF